MTVAEEEAVFLEQILEFPEDDTTRLVFADWLEEHDRGQRAAEIRNGVRGECRRVPLLAPAPGFVYFIRGFPEVLEVNWESLAVVGQLLEEWPLQRVDVLDRNGLSFSVRRATPADSSPPWTVTGTVVVPDTNFQFRDPHEDRWGTGFLRGCTLSHQLGFRYRWEVAEEWRWKVTDYLLPNLKRHPRWPWPEDRIVDGVDLVNLESGEPARTGDYVTFAADGRVRLRREGEPVVGVVTSVTPGYLSPTVRLFRP